MKQLWTPTKSCHVSVGHRSAACQYDLYIIFFVHYTSNQHTLLCFAFACAHVVCLLTAQSVGIDIESMWSLFTIRNIIECLIVLNIFKAIFIYKHRIHCLSPHRWTMDENERDLYSLKSSIYSWLFVYECLTINHHRLYWSLLLWNCSGNERRRQLSSIHCK